MVKIEHKTVDQTTITVESDLGYDAASQALQALDCFTNQRVHILKHGDIVQIGQDGKKLRVVYAEYDSCDIKKINLQLEHVY